MSQLVHRRLDCGIELGVAVLADRPTAAIEFRVLAGTAHEPPDRLGLARLIDETLEKGTARRDGRALLDAFDAIGAQRSSGPDREYTAFRCLCLPEFLPQVIELHAEMLRTPTFPQESCEVAVELALQELLALEDDPPSLADKYITRQSYGPLLGRHPLGEPETIRSISRETIEQHWRSTFAAGRMLVGVAGRVDPHAVADELETAFAGFGNNRSVGREPFPIDFQPVRTHHAKEAEQEQIAICFPGVAATHPDYPVQSVLLGVLSGGMSGRLFTEIREKEGLVYWVGAWADYMRGYGMIHLGTSTKPEHSDRTFEKMLREIDRLAEDLEAAEIQRAIVGLVAKTQTYGDITRAHCSEIVGDLFHFGRPIPIEEKIARLERVSLGDIQRYLREHPRDRLSVVTLGPKELTVGLRS